MTLGFCYSVVLLKSGNSTVVSIGFCSYFLKCVRKLRAVWATITLGKNMGNCSLLPRRNVFSHTTKESRIGSSSLENQAESWKWWKINENTANTRCYSVKTGSKKRRKKLLVPAQAKDSYERRLLMQCTATNRKLAWNVEFHPNIILWYDPQVLPNWCTGMANFCFWHLHLFVSADGQ